MVKKNTFNKIAQVSARVRPWVREVIKKNNYSISDAVTYFADCLKRDNPVEVLKIQIFCAEEKIKRIHEAQRELQHEEDDAIEDLEMLKDELSKYDVELTEYEPIDLTDEKEVEEYVDDDMKIAIQRVQTVFDEKKDLLFSPDDTKEDILDVLISLNGDMFYNLHKDFGKGSSWIQFKQDLAEGLVV